MLAPLSNEVLIEAVEALESTDGNRQKAADKLGIPVSTLKTRIKKAKKRGIRGQLPEFDLIHPAAPGMVVKGTSTLYGPDGEIEQQWSKTQIEGADPEDVVRLPDPKTITKVSTLYNQEGRVTQQWIAEKPADIARIEAWRAFAKELAEALPRAEPIPSPLAASEDLLACYPVGDHHLGMAASLDESDDDYDIDIADRLICGAIDYLLQSSPHCDQALIGFLGDFLHYDGVAPVTPSSKNLLDVDGRFSKMVKAGIRAMRYLIDASLRRHKNVHVIVEIGNHDLSSSIFLMECLANIYENEPRITIDTSPKHFHYYQFGQVLIGTHHGHGAKMEQLPIIMATDMPEAWGSTKHRIIWTGHVHHSQQKDVAGVDVKSFRVLAPQDAWASQCGYRSIRDMKAFIMHREHGEVASTTVKPGMLSR